jgi:leucyl-tRNA synthetase
MAKELFDHFSIEAAAQQKWNERAVAHCDLEDSKKDPYYLLFEFPYPSGDLHTGHWYAFALNDILARYKKMTGVNVLFPIGFDAFGLPAENAAIKNGISPKTWTYENIAKMREQVKKMGTLVDWSKEVVTSDPEYYKWTQWLFIKFFEQGIIERKKAPVKWCAQDATVLANEQVVNGVCERCGNPVEEKVLTQWFMKISDYAERLIADLDPLPWKEDIKESQRQWIGKSEGALLTFDVVVENGENVGSVEVFTTRADTVFGATYLVVSPEHALISTAKEHISNIAEVSDYQTQTKRKTELERTSAKEKTGAKLSGLFAINPATKDQVPVYCADYVLGSYGTGAVMAVPAHDERDFEFAAKFSLPVVQVIDDGALPYTGDGVLVSSGEFTGRNNREALADIVRFANGSPKVNYRLRDWLVSRQRYWGCPIPVVYDPEGNPHAVKYEHLPWMLPEDADYRPTGDSPLSTSQELKERVVRLYGEGWTPDCDTLDTFVDSSWYYLRYLDPHNAEGFTSQALVKKWMPVNRYSGGAEHTTMHLLYSRFFYKVLYDLGLVPTHEPFVERMNRGLLMGEDGRKMSKRWGNVINPEKQVELYGSDTVRMYLAFMGPYNETGSYPWSASGIESIRRFLDRVYALRGKVADAVLSEEDEILLHSTIAKVNEDIPKFKYNTAIASLMIFLNALEKMPAIPAQVYTTFITLLSPFAPHLCEHLSNREVSLVEEVFPVADQSVLQKATCTMAVQINGKKKGEVQMPQNATEQEVLTKALGLESVQKALDGKTQEKVIFVQNRILNLLVK